MHRTYSMVGVKGQDQGRAIGHIHLIDYNFVSNCHRDFKLGSYFSLWKAAPNMTLTLKSSTKVKIFETCQIRKTSQNMLGEVKVKAKQKVKFTKLVITSCLIVTKTLNFVKGASNMTLTSTFDWPWKVQPRSKIWKHQLMKTRHNLLLARSKVKVKVEQKVKFT